MVRKVIIFSLFLVSLDLFSINIKLDKFIPNPSMMRYNAELKEISKNQKRLSFSYLAWLNKKELLLQYSPFFFIYDISSDSLIRSLDIEEAIGYDHPVSLSYINSSFINIRSGHFLEPNYYLYHKDNGLKVLKNLEEYKKLPSSFTSHFNQEKHFEDFTFWAFNLYGGHKIVPGPQYLEEYNHTYEYGINLKMKDNEYLNPIPEEYYLAKILGSSSNIALSFDRFQMVLFSHNAYKSENDYIEKKNSVIGYFIFKIEYQGRVKDTSYIMRKPTDESDIVREVKTDESFIVVEADNYYVDNEVEDFWYLVKTEGKDGWIKGDNLLVEGLGWENRLLTRGNPIYWDDITEDGEYIPYTSLVEDSEEVEDSNRDPSETIEEPSTIFSDQVPNPEPKISKELMKNIIIGLTLLILIILVGFFKKSIKEKT